LNYSQAQVPELDQVIDHYGSGYFEGCGYQQNVMYPMDQPLLMNELYAF